MGREDGSMKDENLLTYCGKIFVLWVIVSAMVLALVYGLDQEAAHIVNRVAF